MRTEEDFDDLPDEVDFTGGVRGYFATRLKRETVAVVIEPELHELFPTSEAVNAALRLVVQAGELTAKTHAKAS
jgi:hypothetical protein